MRPSRCMYGMVGGKKSLRDVYTLTNINSNHMIPNLPLTYFASFPSSNESPGEQG